MPGGYALAAISAGLCFLTRWWLDGILNTNLPFGLFFVPVVATAWKTRLGPSVLATGLGLMGGTWFLLDPRQTLAQPGAVRWVLLAGYLLACLLLCGYAETMRKFRRQLEQDGVRIKQQEQQLLERIAKPERTEAALRGSQQHQPPVLEAIPHQVGEAGPDQRKLERLVEERTLEIERLKRKLEGENCYLREKVSLGHRHYRLVGQGDAIRHVISQAEQVAGTDSTVLLLGETGTGKELLAATLHELSMRRGGTLISVNCAAMPAPLVESELFGREKGAFTGSLTRQIGRFELANDSTIFLDEVGELSPEVQAKLLRVLEAKQIERLGNPKPVTVNVRVIAATNRDLDTDVREGRFRRDLYYRLNVFPIRIPPLRERREDIPLLVWAFVDEFAKLFNKKIRSIDRESMDGLQRYGWPGNVRELRNIIERAMIISTGPKLRVQLPSGAELTLSAHPRKLEEVERLHILAVLERSGWRIRGDGGAAEQLGLKPTTLEARMAKLGIHRPSITAQA
ncbi:MAG TPA: sigma 54-interacting transcriptional regulator [Verrucomicrobiae bacterium]|nr:sigma 54-interacting transcriptional regulator [Verrucomicrobiae bacterium]